LFFKPANLTVGDAFGHTSLPLGNSAYLAGTY